MSIRVMVSLSFSEALAKVHVGQDDRVSMRNLRNARGLRFALSPLGEKYFSSAILKTTGIVNRRIDDVAGALPKHVDGCVEQVRPLLQEYKSHRG